MFPNYFGNDRLFYALDNLWIRGTVVFKKLSPGYIAKWTFKGMYSRETNPLVKKGPFWGTYVADFSY